MYVIYQDHNNAIYQDHHYHIGPKTCIVKKVIWAAGAPILLSPLPLEWGPTTWLLLSLFVEFTKHFIREYHRDIMVYNGL
jgi:hypothetical protein